MHPDPGPQAPQLEEALPSLEKAPQSKETSQSKEGSLFKDISSPMETPQSQKTWQPKESPQARETPQDREAPKVRPSLGLQTSQSREAPNIPPSLGLQRLHSRAASNVRYDSGRLETVREEDLAPRQLVCGLRKSVVVVACSALWLLVACVVGLAVGLGLGKVRSASSS